MLGGDGHRPACRRGDGVEPGATLAEGCRGGGCARMTIRPQRIDDDGMPTPRQIVDARRSVDRLDERFPGYAVEERRTTAGA